MEEKNLGIARFDGLIQLLRILDLSSNEYFSSDSRSINLLIHNRTITLKQLHSPKCHLSRAVTRDPISQNNERAVYTVFAVHRFVVSEPKTKKNKRERRIKNRKIEWTAKSGETFCIGSQSRGGEEDTVSREHGVLEASDIPRTAFNGSYESVDL